MSDTTHTVAHTHDDGSATRKKIFQVTAILSALTALEFVIVGVMPSSTLRIAIFIGLTLIKAFYIISVFMHLGDEVKRLGWSILLPFLFIVWLLLALGDDGRTYGERSLKDANPVRVKVAAPAHGEHGTEHHEAAPATHNEGH